MSIFSFLKKAPKEHIREIEEKEDYSNYFTNDIIWDIIDSNSSSMLFFTKKDGWVGANKLFFKTFNFVDIEDFRTTHKSVRDLFSHESEEIFTEDDRSWLDYIKKHRKNGYHITIHTPNNEMLTVNAKCHSVDSMSGFYILELEDITKLHFAELKISEVEKLKSKFLANIGHEFRTPMNGILGFIELMEETELSKNQLEYMQMISKSSKNLMQNIETLLDLSQMQGGRLTLSPSKFSISQEMEKIIYNYMVIAKNKNIDVFSFIDPKLPSAIDADFRKINQVMRSLIENAIKFTPSGGRIIIEVKLLKKQVNGDCNISFSVKDNGKGIANEQLNYITEPFTAGNQADERLGVGLSLSHGLVKLFGSELKIQSEEGYGSYFSFTLSFKASKGQSYKMLSKKKVKVLLLDSSRVNEANFLTTYLRSFAIDVIKSNALDQNVYDDVKTLFIIADQADDAWVTKLSSYTKKVPVVFILDEHEKLKTKLTHLVDFVFRKPLLPSIVSRQLATIYANEKIEVVEQKNILKDNIIALIAEDNLINQRLTQILLEGYNIKVEMASDGNEALAKCSKVKYDIIFMDIDMPEKDGIVTTKEIKQNIKLNARTPIVALTAMAMQGDKERLIEAGLDDYMPKPLTRDKLEKILEKYLKIVSV